MKSMNRAVELAWRSFAASRAFSISSTKCGKLDGRIAIATGCTEGIGYEIAKRLAVDGAHVIISSRQKNNVDKAANSLKEQGLSVSGFVCHVANEKERNDMIESTVKEHGGIDILVNNAGVNPFTGSFFETPDDAFNKAWEVNVKSNFYLVRDVLPHMENRGKRGSIVITSSMGGYHAHLMPSAYVVSKGALFSLVRAMVPDLSEKNIRVNCIAISLFKTKFGEILIENSQMNKDLLSLIPMKRFGEPDECAGLASFLCSDDASYITGESFAVAGGAYSRL